MQNISLSTLAGGALQEKFNIEFGKIMENIRDVNTDHKIKRKMNIEISFVSSEDRELAIADINVKIKLAPTKSVGTKFTIDTRDNGEVIASEYQKQLPGQRCMKVDPLTGEILTTEEENIEPNLDGIKLVK